MNAMGPCEIDKHHNKESSVINTPVSKTINIQ